MGSWPRVLDQLGSLRWSGVGGILVPYSPGWGIGVACLWVDGEGLGEGHSIEQKMFIERELGVLESADSVY